MREETAVGIIGAGPAGLLLANLLTQENVACVVLEQHTREYIEHRTRAGAFEGRIVHLLDAHGLADTLLRDSIHHGGCEFRLDGKQFQVPYAELTGNAHYLYPQQSLARDLIASYLGRGGQLRFSTRAESGEGCDGDRPVIRHLDRETGERHELHCRLTRIRE